MLAIEIPMDKLNKVGLSLTIEGSGQVLAYLVLAQIDPNDLAMPILEKQIGFLFDGCTICEGLQDACATTMVFPLFTAPFAARDNCFSQFIAIYSNLYEFIADLRNLFIDFISKLIDFILTCIKFD